MKNIYHCRVLSRCEMDFRQCTKYRLYPLRNLTLYKKRYFALEVNENRPQCILDQLKTYNSNHTAMKIYSWS